MKKKSKVSQKLPFECIALVLQGGGALGAYQAGVYEALAESGVYPNWVAGISIGAINAAIIAGNAPEERVEKLRGFWNAVTAKPWQDWTGLSTMLSPRGTLARSLFNRMSAGYTLFAGAPDFFELRAINPFLQPDGTVEATSYYDTSALKNTLERFVDFDRINRQEIRFSVGSVNIRTGNFIYFDNTRYQIRPEHIIASGSLPPGFAPTEIEGEYYWDGGLISNTPLEWVIDGEVRQDTLAFQVDLWNARGELPQNLSEVMTRQKEIQYSSRTRAATNHFKRVQSVRNALANLIEKLPKELKKSNEVALLEKVADHKVYNIVQLIYRAKQYEIHSKDYEFSRLTMQEHWQAGYHDVLHTLKHSQVLERPNNPEGVFTFDILRDGEH